jgi:hypothetical protein
MTLTRHQPGPTSFAVPVDDALVALTVRMTEEYPELAAGSVMRCVARAVLRARLSGVPRDHLTAAAECTARSTLDGRVAVPARPRSA